MKIYNSATIREDGIERAKVINSADAFFGSPQANLTSVDSKGLIAHFEDKSGLDTLERIRYRVKNEAKPTPELLAEFFGRYYIDVTRRAKEAPDLTSLIAREETNYDFPELLSLRDIFKYRGVMTKIFGNNAPGSMIEQNTGNLESMRLSIKGLGWQDTLYNQVYNSFFSIDKVIQAAVDAYTDARNAALIGTIVGTTFTAGMKQAAITTTGLTRDEKTYETYLAAEQKLRTLLDRQTKRKIAVPEIGLLVNSSDTWRTENVIRGQLNGNGSNARIYNRPALPITRVIEYDRGINDGFEIGGIAQSFPGVPAGKAYMFVPNVAIVANKRPLTMQVGKGSVLEFSTEERSWYYIDGIELRDLLGSSYAGTELADGFGNIIEITLPA